MSGRKKVDAEMQVSPEPAPATQAAVATPGASTPSPEADDPWDQKIVIRNG